MVFVTSWTFARTSLSLNREDIVVINGKRNIAFERKIKKQSKRIKVFYSNYEIESFKKLKKKVVGIC